MNITDYINVSRETFQEKKLSEVDSLMFCQLFYARWEDQAKLAGLDMINPGYTVKDFNKLEYDKVMYCDGIADEENREFNLRASANIRFRDLKVKNIVTETSAELGKQFAAVAFEVDETSDYICFRGTDGSMTGWREAFEMSFKNVVPSQKEAVEYVNRFYGPGSEGEKRKLYLGGHSKGGNLAVYASLMCDESIQERIVEVFSHDGPGFRDDVYKVLVEHQKRSGVKISKTIPQTSIIGMTMNTRDDAQVVKSSGKGIMQHSTLTWLVENDSFVHLDKLTNSGEYMDRTLHDLLDKSTDENRKNFFDSAFEFLKDNRINSVQDLRNMSPLKMYALKESFKNLNPENREALDIMFKSLMKSALDKLLH